MFPIKYRAWVPALNSMSIWEEISLQYKTGMEFECLDSDSQGGHIHVDKIFNDFSNGGVIFMPYIGTRDEDNTEIYVHDILEAEFTSQFGSISTEIGFVTYVQELNQFVIQHPHHEKWVAVIKNNKVKVVGNIYQHPYLLEKK